MASESELMKFLRENPPANKFVPYCHISEDADALTVYFEGDPDYSERLSEHVTLYRSLKTNELVGCRIKGIAGILAALPNYIHVNHDGIQLSLIFLACRGGAEEASETIDQLAKAAAEKNMTLQTAG